MSGQQPQYDPRSGAGRRAGGYGALIAAGALALAVAGCSAGGTASSAGNPGSGSPAAAQPAAQPETEAGVRDAATQFYALYSAGQWAQAWRLLAPATQQGAPEATYVAVHQGCPSAAAGLARVIKGVTMAGSTAVVTETVAGAASALGSVTDAWTYAGGRWGLTLAASDLAAYSHGSAQADVAALKAKGECAS